MALTFGQFLSIFTTNDASGGRAIKATFDTGVDDAANYLTKNDPSGGRAIKIVNVGSPLGPQFWTEAYNAGTQATSSWTPVGAATNINAAIIPKGSGAIVADIPDGTATGGNARGSYAVDLQMARANQERIATGAYSVISGGYSNRIHPQAGAYGIYCAIGGGNNNDCYGGNASTIAGGDSNRTTYDKCFIGGGTSNQVNAGHGVVSGGQSNTVSGDTGTIGGGQSNTASGAHSVAVGGQTNTASGQHSFVGGGNGNTASARYNIVVGGESNNCSGANQGNFIGGGKFNSLGPFAQDAVLVGGRSNSVSGGYAFLGSGNINSAGGDRSAVVSGTGNSSSGYHSFVGDGAYNLASGSYSAIVCGGNFDTDTDKNTASGTLSFVGNGRKNVASGTYAFVGNGFTNVASQLYSIVVGGDTNTVSNNYGTIGGGVSNSVSGQWGTISGGSTNTASASYSSVLGGLNANASLYGQQAHASGRFSANGDAQAHELVWRREITGTAQTELFLDGASVAAILPGTNAIWQGVIDIAAVCTATGDGSTIVGHVEATSYKVTIKRIGTTTSLVGTVQEIGTTNADASMATAVITIDNNDTNESLRIRFTPPGTAGSTTVIRVVATFRGLQIQY